jgi:hypothetical protein
LWYLVPFAAVASLRLVYVQAKACSLTIEEADAGLPEPPVSLAGSHGGSHPADLGVVESTTGLCGSRQRQRFLWGSLCHCVVRRESQALEGRLTRHGFWPRLARAQTSDSCVTVSHEGGQVTKSAWWMPRRREAMKDVVGCDKPRVAVKLALIRGSPNRETGRHWATRWRHLQVNA